ncbi:MAG: bifunctional diaminohydroxyphosphoribosylaminopyrimidine deaminase/5-amino-6-(5-phosphoribosylamino)uracil reductase RibD, partial [Patescibacteria group bacterium]
MSNFLSNPTAQMRRALRLAEKGRGWVLPNPMVGAILVKDGERIGEGFHQKYGEDHAEVAALKNMKGSAEGATLYVTLEPCSHTGKTPPCAEAVIKAGIKKVVIAVKDPSEKVNGKGIELLKKAGIEVELGLLEKEARDLNKNFFTFHEKKRPFISAKVALSLDGKMAESR